MSWRDRPYAGEESPRGSYRLGPRMTSVVKLLVIVNVGVALLIIAMRAGGRPDPRIYGTLHWHDSIFRAQLWRLVTYQYFHADFWHLLMNMLVLWFMGPLVEQALGPRKFFWMYTFSGVVAGLLFLAMVPVFGMPPDSLLLGASGSILGVMAVAAMLYPNQTVYLFFAIAMRMRTLAIGLAAFFLLFAIAGNLSHVAHIGGMIGGAGWILVGRRFQARSPRRSAGRWQRRQQQIAREQEQVDRILAKVHEKGINSLNWLERRTLRKATEHQRQRERQVDEQFRQR